MRPVLLLVLTATACAGHPWEPDRFLIGVWGCPTDAETAAAFAEAGFNTVMGPADRLDLCHEYGMRVIVRDATVEEAAGLAEHPGVWGWFIYDEPKAEQFAEVGGRMAAFAQADPAHPGYVNLMAWMDLGQYLETVRPPFLSYDYYQWWWKQADHFWRLEAHRQAALEAAIPLICWVEANADKRWEWGEAGQGYLPDNEPKLRHSVYSSLAYGVKGIQWFNDYLVFEHATGRRLLPRLRQSGEDVRGLNGELRMLGPVLLRLTSTAVYHTEPVPPHTTQLPDDCPVLCTDPEITLGLFTDADGVGYVMVMNRSISAAQTVTLRLADGPAEVGLFGRGSGQWLRVQTVPDGAAAAVTLRVRPGDGELLRLSAG